MGEDKALLRLVPGGPAIIELAIATAHRVASDVFIVSPLEREYERFGVRVVDDRYPGEGPLGGIVTALGAARHDACLVVSCDHPFLSAPLLRWMAEYPGLEGIVPETARGDGWTDRHLIHARYRREHLPIIEAAFLGGERRASSLLDLTPVRMVREREIVRFDPGMRSLLSVNTPADAERARAIAAAMLR